MVKKQILIVEDEAITANDLKTMLEGLGYEITECVDSGMLALKIVKQSLPDLVLMDIGLHGEMDGIEAARQIWAEFKVPVVFLTGFSDETTVIRAEVAEPFGYLLKPINRNEIRASLQLAFYKYQVLSRLLETNRRIVILHKVSRNFAKCSDISEIFSVIEEAVAEIFQPKYFMLNSKGSLSLSTIGISDEESLIYFKKLLDSNNSLTEEKIIEYVQDDGINSVIVTPVKNIGVFIISSESGIIYDQEDLNQVKLMLGYAEGAYNRISLESELKRKAIHDSLTGLFNRYFLETTINREVNQAKRYQHPIGFLLLDINDLKHINDIYGHKTGDNLLVEVSTLILSQVRSVDTVVRYGGDEFLVMLPETGVEVDILKSRLIASKENWNKSHDQLDYKLDFAIGVSFWQNNGDESIEDAIDRADQNMYDDKLEMKLSSSMPNLT